MKKGYLIIILLSLISGTMSIKAQDYLALDRFEFGAYAGLGMYFGPNADIKGVEHIQAYSNKAEVVNWPGIESFGFSVGYRYDLRWQFKLQTMRQRMAFEEVRPKTTPVYYNAMWHLDAMAEFNILRYGEEMHPGLEVYNVVPFVGLGYGLTFYNQNATLRSTDLEGEKGFTYPRVGYSLDKDSNGKLKATKAPVNTAMYIPMACGVKWRINGNVQIKGTFQYHLFFQSAKASSTLNANLCGSTSDQRPGKTIYGGAAGSHHNIMLSLGVIANLGDWDEDLAKKNVNY